MFSSCEEFVQIDPPRTELVKAAVFANDATALAAMTDIYYQVGVNGYASGSIQSITYLASLSCDELVNGITYDENFQQVNENEILPINSTTTFAWSDMYSCIYKCNAILEGVEDNENLTAPVRQRLEGEAKFFRAFTYFYLVNIFGEVPLVLTTDYKVNAKSVREETAVVYEHIISDLEAAQQLLANDYLFSAGARVRVNSAGATAMLARVFLYQQEWEKAEVTATALIEDPNFELLGDLKSVFLKNSRESILQFYPMVDGYTNEVVTFLGYGSYLRPEFVADFESNDSRKDAWIENGNYAAEDYPIKYYSFDGDFSEYSVVLRLAEQYLIRAEARVKLNRITDAQADLNLIRERAGLANTSANDATTLMDAILHERKVELFTEWGHRWFDLKRTNKVNEVLQDTKTDWAITDELYPIPEAQINNSIGMPQNPGY
jgi:starch-binding outer membrane protein, SusD/RagB family